MNPLRGPSGPPAAVALTAAALVFLTACATGGSAPTAHGSSTAAALTARQALRAAEADADNLNSVADTFSVRAVGAAPTTSTGTSRYQLSPTLESSADIRTEMPGITTRMRTITTDTAIYMNVGSAGMFPGTSTIAGKPWIKLRLTGLKALGGAMAGMLADAPVGQGATISVHLRISQLAKDVHAVGAQVIGGVPTTEYAGSYRVDQVLKALSAGDRKQVELDQLLKVRGSGPVSFRVWIDGQHHLRKLVEIGTANGTTTTSTDYFSAFNQPVHVTPPPASQVTTFGS